MTRVLLIIDDYNEMIYLQTLLKKLGFDAEAIGNTRVFTETMLGFNPSVLIMTAHGKKINGLKLSTSITKRNGTPAIILLRSIGQVFADGEIDAEQIDLVVDSPVNILNLVRGICELSGQPFEPVSEKLTKVLTSDAKARQQAKDAAEANGGSGDQNTSSNAETPELIRVRGGKLEKERASIISGEGNKKSEIELIKGDKQDSEVQKVTGDVSKPVSTMGWEERQKKYDDYLAKVTEKPDTKQSFPRDKIKDYNRKHRKSERTEEMEKLDEEKKKFVNAMYSHLKSS